MPAAAKKKPSPAEEVKEPVPAPTSAKKEKAPRKTDPKAEPAATKPKPEEAKKAEPAPRSKSAAKKGKEQPAPAKPETPPAKAEKKSLKKDKAGKKQEEAKEEKQPYLGVQPLKPRSAYNFFGMAQSEFPEGTPNLDRMKVIGQRWAALKDEDRAKWEKMAADDKARQQSQLDEIEVQGYFTLEDGTRSCDIRYRKGNLKDYPGVMPKKAPSVYNLFMKEWKAPEGTKNSDRLGLCSEAFKSCPEKDLKRYQATHEAELKRYERQIAEIETKGFFVMEDGKRSDQVEPKSKKKVSKKANDPTSESEEDPKPAKKKVVKAAAAK